MTSSSSAYLKEDYVKRKFLNTWEEICELQKIPPTIEVVHEDGAYSGTHYPEVNRRVQRILKTDEFPDHMDIYEVIERCNVKHSLGIGESEKSELSRKVFKEVGKIIKSRRIKDYQAHFGSHLTDTVKLEADPAIQDSQLMERLSTNLQEGKKKMEALCEDFIVKQEQEGEGKSGGGDGATPPQDGSSSDEDEDEEDDEEVAAEVDDVVAGLEGGTTEETDDMVDVELDTEEDVDIEEEVSDDLDVGGPGPDEKYSDVNTNGAPRARKRRAGVVAAPALKKTKVDSSKQKKCSNIVTSTSGEALASYERSESNSYSESNVDVDVETVGHSKQKLNVPEAPSTSGTFICLSDSEGDGREVVIISDSD